MQMGKYEIGRTLGEGHFGKVRLAQHAGIVCVFAIKILDGQRIPAMKIDEQVEASVNQVASNNMRLYNLPFMLLCRVLNVELKVQVVSLNQVMSEGAYMLFYLRSFPRPPRIYIEMGLLPVPTSAKRHSSKSSKGSKQEQKQT